jgi:hypothetical protein
MDIKQKEISTAKAPCIRRKASVDGLRGKFKQPLVLDFHLFEYVKKTKSKATLFSKKGRTESFFTEDSKKYLTHKELVRLKRGEWVGRISGRLDGLNSRRFEKTKIYSITSKDVFYLQTKRRYSSFRNYLLDLVEGSTRGVSMIKMWNLSVVGAVIFGMFTMTMVYRYLGESVSAKIQENKAAIAGASTENNSPKDKNFNDEIDVEFMTKLLSDYKKFEREDEDRQALKKEILAMVKGYPIEKMVPYIIKKDRKVAALVVAIARKESGWGEHVPVLNGQDCFNYWGYRGLREKMGTGGHTCFDSPEDAVDTIAKRIEFLVSSEKLNTPEKMVVWKCGYDCSWDSKTAVAKWISDVDYYFKKLDKKTK